MLSSRPRRLRRRNWITRSTNGLPSSNGVHCGSTNQVRSAFGWFCLSAATAGSVWRMSPMAPRRTTRIRLVGLPSADMFLQFAHAARLVGFEMGVRLVPAVGDHHVVYYPQCGDKFGARALWEEGIIERENNGGDGAREVGESAGVGGEERIEVAGDDGAAGGNGGGGDDLVASVHGHWWRSSSATSATRSAVTRV